MHSATPPAAVRTPRLTAALGLFAAGAAVFCIVVGYVLVSEADERLAFERRAALTAAIAELRASGADLAALSPEAMRALERTAGLSNLRYEAGPTAPGRELHSLLDRQGRIVGWLSWRADRSMAAILQRLQPLLIGAGLCFVGFAGVALWQMRRAVRELATSEQRAWALAHRDSLTGLPSPRRMLEMIDEALAERRPPQAVTLALVDVDRMSDVNAAYGRHVGDRLLVEWTARLAEVAPAGSVAGRLDGDEFAVLTPSTDPDATERALEIAASALARLFWIDGHVVQTGATIGFAHAPRHAATRDELIRRAGLALRAGKRQRRGGVTGFDPALDVEFDERKFLEHELRRALTDGTLDVHYQPIVTADGARIVGAEALLRWVHPERGEIAPMTFVAVAEQSGLMGRLGAFALRRALTDAARWPQLTIAVNLSPVQMRDGALVEQVAEALAVSGIAPPRVVLEVTESVLIDDPAEAKARLEALRGLGVRIALDDFGTGYSSLSYLQQFRFDKLKIDKSFVAPLGRDPGALAMVQAIISLGRALGLTLLAEGVETEAQRVELRLAGCEELQGYLFGRPGPREALDIILARRKVAAADRPTLRPVQTLTSRPRPAIMAREAAAVGDPRGASA